MCCLLALLVLLSKCASTSQGGSKMPNVLFIVVNNLRPELGCYGNNAVISPNIDRIAEKGFFFERAYCQYPLCGPSRCSMLSGLYPTRSRYTNNSSSVDKDTPDIASLPEHFKRHGYYTISNGKIFHDHGNVIDGLDSWSEIPWETHPGFWVWLEDETRQYTFQGYKHRKEYSENPGPSWEAAAFTRCNNAETIITEKYVYTEWQTEEGEEFQKMLFDHDQDKNENNNLAESFQHQEIIQKLSKLLKQHIDHR
jgi:arylsulfatase A-like enzyme